MLPAMSSPEQADRASVIAESKTMIRPNRILNWPPLAGKRLPAGAPREDGPV